MRDRFGKPIRLWNKAKAVERTKEAILSSGHQKFWGRAPKLRTKVEYSGPRNTPEVSAMYARRMNPLLEWNDRYVPPSAAELDAARRTIAEVQELHATLERERAEGLKG
jgi:hypothetical protein